ncbi:MAG TPA: epimerase [Thermoanaerobaculia bacterium]|jgi:hypothetical protein
MTRVRDEAIADWDMIVGGDMKDAHSQRIAATLKRLSPDVQRLIGDLIPKIVDTTMHHLLWALNQEEDSVQVHVEDDSGDLVNVNERSDGLPGELYEWLPRFSRQRFTNPADET